MIKKMIYNLLNDQLKSRGYIIKPLGNELKKSNILDIEDFASYVKPIIREKMTSLREDRLYTIWQAVTQTMDNPEGAMAEIGVYKGGSAKFIASILKGRCRHNIVLHIFDTFEGAPDQHDAADGAREKGLFKNTSFDIVRSYLSGLSNVRFYKGTIQDQARNVSGLKFLMIHLDVNIYAPTVFSLDYFGDRMLSGGIIVLDDYGFKTCPGVKKAADEFMKKNCRRFRMIHLMTGQAVIVRIG